MSQKSINSSPMDQTRAGSWKESLKAPRMDEAEGKITWMNRENRAEKGQGYASPSQLCRWLTFQSFLWDLTHAPSSVPVSCWAGGPWLAGKGLWSIPCPPAVPWTKARKCCMPRLPLMHLSSSHWSAFCQFRSSAVGWSAQMTSGVACKIPRKLSSSHQHPPASLKEAAGGRPANHPELGVSDRLWDAHMVFARITRSCQGQPVQLLCLSSLQMSIFSCRSLQLALNFLQL